MIDPLTEDIIHPKEAARTFPRGPSGKHAHVSKVYRAMRNGCRGIILESLQTPTLVTSRQAVARFLVRLTEQGRQGRQATRSPRDFQPEHRRTESELDRLGI